VVFPPEFPEFISIDTAPFVLKRGAMLVRVVFALKKSVLLLLLCASLAEGSFNCPETLREVWGRPWDTAAYEVALDKTKKSQLSVTDLDTPEKLFAYGDSFGEPFFDQQRLQIESRGAHVHFQGYLWPLAWNFHGRAPELTAKGEWRRTFGVPWYARHHRALVRVPYIAPTSVHEAVSWIIQVAGSFIRFQMLQIDAVASARGPDSGVASQALMELERMESQLYQMLSNISRRYPHLVLALPPNDGIWAQRQLQLGRDLLPCLVFPYFEAMSPYFPNEEHYKAWQHRRLGLLLKNKYEARWLGQRAVRRYRHLLAAGIIVAAPIVAVGAWQETFPAFSEQQTDSEPVSPLPAPGLDAPFERVFPQGVIPSESGSIP
jgi:hypothetical protein